MFQLEHASVSTEPAYQEKKRNQGQRKLDISNADCIRDAISLTTLKRHLKFDANEELNDDTEWLFFVLIGLAKFIDQCQRQALLNGISAQDIVEAFESLPKQQEEFRSSLLEYSKTGIPA